MRKDLLKGIVLGMLLCGLALAAGLVEESPQAARSNAAALSQVRRDNLQSGVRGPLGSLHLCYRDSWKGKKRTFLWSAQSFENPDGTLAYALVLRQVEPKPVDLVLGGSTTLSLGDMGGEDPDDRYRVVYAAFEDYLRRHPPGKRLKPTH